MSNIEKIEQVLWQEIVKNGNRNKLRKKDIVSYAKMIDFSLDCSKDGNEVQVLMRFLSTSVVPMTFKALGLPEDTAKLEKLAARLAVIYKNNKFGTSHWTKIALVKINNWAIKYGAPDTTKDLAKELIKLEPELFKTLKGLKKKTIVFLGDSQMDGRIHWSTLAGFPHILDAAFNMTNKNLKAVNSGIGGNKVWQGIARFKTDVLVHKPQACVFMFGGNDCTKDDNGKIKTPLPLFKEFYAKLVKDLRKNKIVPVMMSGTYSPKSIETYPIYLKYNDAITEMSRKLNVPLIDVFNKMRNMDLSDIICADGDHLTTEGHLFLAKTMAEFLVSTKY